MGYVFLYSVKFVRVLTDIIKLSNKSVYSWKSLSAYNFWECAYK